MVTLNILLYADYADWPLWWRGKGSGGLLAEEALPLSDGLKSRIRAWLNAYDSDHPTAGWPMWTPPPGVDGVEEQEEAWAQEGAEIRELIAAELGPGYEVVYET